MKQILMSLLVLILSGNLYSQTISGTVYDDKTKKPIAEVNVYLDGTSIHTTTNSSGKFELVANKTINTKLVVSHIAYDAEYISNPFDKTPDKIYLKEKPDILGEVIVVTDKFTRKEKLKAFREQFLGITKGGKSCKIINESDIQLSFDLKTNTLTATSGKPLIIENEYLQYKIQFGLVHFTVSYNQYTLDPKSAKQSFYLGTSSFIDLLPDSDKIKTRRNDIYKASSSNFFRNLANSTLKEAGFAVFNRSYMVNPYNHFIVKDTLSQTLIQIDMESNLDRFVLGVKAPVYGKISVLYKKMQSAIIFSIDSFFVDQYGNISGIDKVLYSGYMGEQRVGSMLPLDYAPTENN